MLLITRVPNALHNSRIRDAVSLESRSPIIDSGKPIQEKTLTHRTSIKYFTAMVLVQGMTVAHFEKRSMIFSKQSCPSTLTRHQRGRSLVQAPYMLQTPRLVPRPATCIMIPPPPPPAPSPRHLLAHPPRSLAFAPPPHRSTHREYAHWNRQQAVLMAVTQARTSCAHGKM